MIMHEKAVIKQDRILAMPVSHCMQEKIWIIH